MSLGKNWEGKASYEAEPEELPDLDARNILRQTEWRKPKGIITPACLFADRRFVLRQKEAQLAFNFSGTRNSASSAGKIKRLCHNKWLIFDEK